MIDERLDGEGHRQVAEWVRDLPEDIPSMAWRAALNDKVRAEAATRDRSRRRWSLARPALGLAMATALALVVVVPRSMDLHRVAPPKESAPRLEARLVALHDETVRDADIVGTGLRPAESPTSVASGVDPMDDLDAGVL